jgi:hypothetical protein
MCLKMLERDIGWRVVMVSTFDLLPHANTSFAVSSLATGSIYKLTCQNLLCKHFVLFVFNNYYNFK